MIEHLLEGDWLLIEIDGEPVDPEAPRSLRFEDGRVSGRVGVNRFTGTYSTNGNVIEIGPVASTRMAGPPELMSLEHHFNTHLEGEHEITLGGDEMVLSEADGAIRLTRNNQLQPEDL
jgi:heat shock protein HslJ